MRERQLIEIIRLKSQQAHPLLRRGIGDDCAIFTSLAAKDWLITTDMLMEDVHFSCRWHPPALLGRKAVSVNISDIAAMGGAPQFALLSLAVPQHLDEQWLAAFVDGFVAALGEQQTVLIGGDTIAGEKLCISVTVLGLSTVPRSLQRQDAHNDEAIYVTGPLGLAAAGLHYCQQQKNAECICISPWPVLLNAHLDPTPQVAFGQLLAQCGLVSAMQDISDGIATDLSHLCAQSQLGAVLEEKLLPVEVSLEAYCREQQLDPRQLQLRGGEDYQLVFTVKKGCEKELEQVCAAAGLHPFRIGQTRLGKGVFWRTNRGEMLDITFQGYEHQQDPPLQGG